jgi:hypothetical protein
MQRYDRPDAPYFYDEVIGGSMSYHRTTCHIIRKIYTRNYKRFRSHEEAQKAGLSPCNLCKPPYDEKLARPPIDALLRGLEEQSDAEPETAFSTTRGAKAASHSDKDISRMRSRIVAWVRKLDEQSADTDIKIGRLIGDLAHNGRIPRQVSGFMRPILELRNVAEYRGHKPTEVELAAVAACFEVLEQWAEEAGLEP